MNQKDIRNKFLKFFEDRGHAIVLSSSLLPDDPSVLFTTAGMQQFKPYYTGEADPMKDFESLNTASIQKSMRTSDIDEVGDESHLTFFEMLGNFSFGGYWKKEAIQLAYDFITKEMGLGIDYVSVFKGNKEVPADIESEKIWKEINPNIRIEKAGVEDNFWGPTGNKGPCGPTTEVYVSGVEIWNIVFNEFLYPGSREELLSGKSNKKLEKLEKPGIDTGMGMERLAMVTQGKPNIFETDLLEPLIMLLPEDLDTRAKRIIADHARASAFLISDGITPSNKEQGYVLRRLLRRIIVLTEVNGLETEVINDILESTVENYDPFYPELDKGLILKEFEKENEKFKKTLKKGIKELEKMETIDAVSAFKLYESYGLPYEIIKEIGRDKAKGLTRESFEEEFKKHQEKSRAGAEKKFGGHGLLMDTGELKAGNEEELRKATRLHTATHLLHASLRKVLGSDIKQAGSDITAERLRFDFTFPRKMTPEEIQKVEDIVNDAIKADYKVTKKEMAYEEAIKQGALAFFKLKYPPIVNVYTIGPANGSHDEPFSRELCGGPHVSHTAEIGKFKITKEESVSAGVRRIRATVD